MRAWMKVGKTKFTYTKVKRPIYQTGRSSFFIYRHDVRYTWISESYEKCFTKVRLMGH